MVTAEAALVLPLLAFVGVALSWVLTIGIADVQLVDGARDGARELARGEDEAVAIQAAKRSAGSDAAVAIQRHDGVVTVVVTRRVSAPGWLLVPLPPVTLHAKSSVEVEDAAES